MSLSTIRAKIKTKLEALSGIENVYDYKRFSRDWATYKELFIKDSKVNTWEIEHPHEERKVNAGDHGVEHVRHSFIIRGFYSLEDSLETDKTFQDLVETVCEDFRDDPTLGAVAEIVHMPITVDYTIGRLGDVVCHIAEIHIDITQRNVY